MRPSRHFWPAVWMITCHPTGELREEQTYPLWFTEWNLKSSPDRKHRWDLKHTIKLWGVSVSKAKAHRRVAKTNVNVSLFNWALTAMRKKNCDVLGDGDMQLLRVWTKSINKTQKWDQSTHWIKDENEEIKRQQRWKIHSWNTNWVHLQPNIRNPHLTEAKHNRFNKKHPPQRQSRKQDGSLYRGAAERVSDHSAFHRGRRYWLSCAAERGASSA